MSDIIEGRVAVIKVILRVRSADDLMLAQRAAAWLLAKPDQKDAIIAYGESGRQEHFYVRRNKSSITVTWIE